MREPEGFFLRWHDFKKMFAKMFFFKKLSRWCFSFLFWEVSEIMFKKIIEEETVDFCGLSNLAECWGTGVTFVLF